MGVFDKIKNALFEVEYVEVEEKPKKEKKHKFGHKDKKNDDNKPIAKKIVLPGKKEEKIEHLEEEELKDEDFEIRPKDESVKEVEKPPFKFMDDEDFEVVEEPQIVEVYDVDENVNVSPEVKEPEVKEPYSYREEPQYQSNNNYYGDNRIANDSYKVKEVQSKPYGVDNSYKLNLHEYGTYEKKEEKQYFKPSPIISPIYGILDKNYKKEDVVSKKEVRITSNYSRSNVNVDDIRNKAFGKRGKNKEEKEKVEDATFEVEEEEDNVLVDLSDEKDKPEVKEVTVGDAMEYFQDLGLEYNVDYVDASKEKKQPKDIEDTLELDIEKQLSSDDTKEEEPKEKKAEEKVEEVEKKEEKHEEKKENVKIEDESKEDAKQDDDNLFDLIDSMYKEDN